MTDYAEEKSQELEILESIYAENYSISKSGRTFSVVLSAEEDEEDHEARQKDQFGVPSLGNFSLRINFTHPGKYPDEKIGWTLERLDEDEELCETVSEATLGTTEDDSATPDVTKWLLDLVSRICEQIGENLGMQQAFVVTSFMQDYLTEKCESLNADRDNEISRLQMEADTDHTKKLIGTPVTLETFTQWQIKFQAEMHGILSEKQSQRERDMANRMTGRVLFHNKLANTDGLEGLGDEFIEDEGMKVTVDEALFGGDDLDDLEDMDLSDEVSSEEDEELRQELFG